jgi:hypothetical protein
MTFLLMTLLAADPVIRISRPDVSTIPTVTVRRPEKASICAAGPHARIFFKALEACLPSGAVLMAGEVSDAGVRLDFQMKKGQSGTSFCSKVSPEPALRNELAACR